MGTRTLLAMVGARRSQAPQVVHNLLPSSRRHFASALMGIVHARDFSIGMPRNRNPGFEAKYFWQILCRGPGTKPSGPDILKMASGILEKEPSALLSDSSLRVETEQTTENDDEIEFIQEPPKEFECPLCLQIMKAPSLSSCCGHHFCRSCIDRAVARNKACPLCKEQPFHVFLNKDIQRQINSLRVRCSNLSRGCKWEGMLGDLERHLDARGGDCDYVTVQCDFSKVGCVVKLLRKEMPQHMNENTQKHILLMLNTNSKISHDYEEQFCHLQQQMKQNEQEMRKFQLHISELQLQLQQQEQQMVKMQVQNQEKDHEIATLKDNVSQLEAMLAQANDKTIAMGISYKDTQDWMKEVNDNVQKLQAQKQLKIPSVPLPEFTMFNFEERKRAGDGRDWYSPPFYTHPGGYKMCLRVRANGQFSGRGTHISLYIHLMHGEYDKSLQWPFQGAITVQLINWRREAAHITHTIHFDNNPEFLHSCLYVDEGRNTTGRGIPQVIAHSKLPRNLTSDTEYLRYDCLRFRITNVRLFVGN